MTVGVEVDVPVEVCVGVEVEVEVGVRVGVEVKLLAGVLVFVGEDTGVGVNGTAQTNKFAAWRRESVRLLEA